MWQENAKKSTEIKFRNSTRRRMLKKLQKSKHFAEGQMVFAITRRVFEIMLDDQIKRLYRLTPNFTLLASEGTSYICVTRNMPHSCGSRVGGGPSGPVPLP